MAKIAVAITVEADDALLDRVAGIIERITGDKPPLPKPTPRLEDVPPCPAWPWPTSANVHRFRRYGHRR